MKKRLSRRAVLSVEIAGERLCLPVDAVEGIAQLPERVAVPGNRSRAMTGLVYVFGKVMPVIDLGPILRITGRQSPKNAVVVTYRDEFYAVQVDSAGSIVSKPAVKRAAGKDDAPVRGTIVIAGKSSRLINIDAILRDHVCM